MISIKVLPLLLAALASLVQLTSAQPVAVSFLNFSPNSIKLYWVDEDDQDVFVESIEAYHEASTDTHVGHTFAFFYGDERETVSISEDQTVHIVGLDPDEEDESIPVDCTTTEGTLHITVKPEWSPRGAARFLELINMDYFEGCALNRCVKNFLTQFGISKDFDYRTAYRQANILDDAPVDDVPFRPGYMAYAGSGPNSRSTEMFIVMPGTSEHQLAHFGDNPWETPFGFVDPEDVANVVAKWHSYGDMPPWGQGPNPQLIYQEDGYEYLARDFPELSYIESCQILDYGDYDDDAADEEEEL